MAVSKAQQKAVTKYDAKAYDKALLRLPKGKLDVVRGHAAAHGESVNGFIGRAITETMERDRGGGVAGRDAPQEAAGAARGDGGIPPPDVLEAAGRAAEAAGEAVEDYVARAIIETVARGRGGNASVSPVQAAGGPQRAGAVSYPSETQKPIQWAAEFTQEAIDRAIADNIDYVRARLNQGEAMARSKGRSKVSAYAKSVMRDIFEAGYSVEELRSAAEKAALDGYSGSWYGLMDYCKNLYGRRHKRR